MNRHLLPHFGRGASRLRNWILGLAGAAALAGAARAQAPLDTVLGLPVARGADPGEILLGELNCVACHGADPVLAARLSPRGAPRLGKDGLRLEPQWLRAWLNAPAASKPGTAMPHVLHGLPANERNEAVEDLVHYLVSVRPEGAPTYITADRARLEMGRELYHTLGCVACHAPTDRPPEMPQDVFDRAQKEGIPLGRLASKYPGAELIAFLKDPVRHRPGGRMPSLGLSDSEARALATFLLRDQAPGLTDPKAPLATVPGVKWEYFEGRVGRLADLDDGRKPVATGDSDQLEVKMHRRENEFAVRFTGALEVPADGEYTFWITSDDGSSLDVDGRRLIDNDGDHPPVEKSGKVRLTKGPHAFEIRFSQNGGGWEFKARWAGPGFDRQPIPGSALKHYGQPMLPVGHGEFAVDAARAARGRGRFAELNCSACHSLADAGGPVTAKAARPLVEAARNPSRGCLADSVPAGAPDFGLAAGQRRLLRDALARLARNPRPAEPAAQVALTTTRLGCLACHQRDGIGGPAATGRDGWFRVLGEADLGEEGKLPPHLEKVGGKLRREWMTKLFAGGTKVRPYMATRMPVFGEANVGHLPELLERVDVAPQGERPEPELTERDAKFGRKLVGRDGLSCIACHTFGNHGSLGIPALALDRMHERLRWDWFRRYLPDPAALRPGTRMPSFWPEGKAVNTEILGGATEPQIAAIWAWMAGGAKADIPAGLIRSRQEIAVGKEAVIYRHFIEGAGTRAIAVGYPEHANLAFDANDQRLALLWQGGFIDMSRHSTDRGAGFEPPLGDHLVKLPAGAPFAVLDAQDAAWPKVAGKAAGYQFLGYDLDAVRRPTFRYRFGGVTVEDAILPKAIDVDIQLTRTLRFSGSKPGGTVWFRAAEGDIKAGAGGEFVVDGKVRMRFRGGTPVVVGRELRVPASVPGELVQEITW